MSRKADRITPKQLPVVRRDIVRGIQYAINAQLRFIDDAAGPMIQQRRSDVRQLQAAPLWWVSHDMFLLALDAAESHTEPREQAAPTPTGFLYFDGRMPTFVEQGVIFPHVCAISWLTDRDGKIGIQYYTNQTDPGWGAALMPFEPEAAYVTSLAFQRLDRLARRLLKAVWALSAIPTIADTSHNKLGSAASSSNQSPAVGAVSTVKIVMLRQAPPAEGDTIDPKTRKPYTHRFIVRGFYRNQAYGKNRSLRRRQWIPPFVKGPADKPLILKDTVHVWSR